MTLSGSMTFFTHFKILGSGMHAYQQLLSKPCFLFMSRKLEEGLAPTTVNIVNESHLHAGHMGNPDGAPDAETHFK